MTLNDYAINERVVKPHWYKHPAFIAIAAFFWYPLNITKPALSAWPGNIREATLFPKQAGMLLTEPDKGGDHLLLID